MPARKIRLDSHNGAPFYRQIIDQILLGIANGDFKPGDRLPTVRRLAIDLEINPNTVSKAYHELELQGVLRSQRGTGTFIAAEPGVALDESQNRRFLDKICDEFIAEAAKFGFTLEALVAALNERLKDRR